MRRLVAVAALAAAIVAPTATAARGDWYWEQSYATGIFQSSTWATKHGVGKTVLCFPKGKPYGPNDPTFHHFTCYYDLARDRCTTVVMILTPTGKRTFGVAIQDYMPSEKRC